MKKVQVGQVYKSNDSRDTERYLEVFSIGTESKQHTHAILRPVVLDKETGEYREVEGRVSRIRVKALGTSGGRGYALVLDPNHVNLILSVWGNDPEAGDKAKSFLMTAAEEILDMGLEVSLDG